MKIVKNPTNLPFDLSLPSNSNEQQQQQQEHHHHHQIGIPVNAPSSSTINEIFIKLLCY